jgi:prepilin-type N-terminal cleavage/methylation domain-containing protein
MRNHQGFTLIELMVTIAVAAIIMAIAVPSMQTMRANSRVSAAANDLASDLKKARNEAILARRNQTLSAIDGSVSSNVWGNAGWRLEQVVSGSTEIVFQNRLVPQGVFINATPNAVVFVAATGMVQTLAGDTVVMTFRVCDSQTNKETGYDVLMNQFGRVLTQKHNDTMVCNP